uniref:Peptidase A1 domain-containing protein n=1 Tax=Hordeum vulgare subsp. vulgare TaxID=112509 RepID=A0A8I7BDP1_HORVV
MKIISVLAAVAILSTSYALDDDCATIWNDDATHRTNTTSAIRLTMLHTQHRCSPVRRQMAIPPSWHHSLALDRERQLEARLLFRRRAPPRNLSTPVTSTIAGGMYGFMAQVAIGTPPRTQTVLIDTAGSLSWVQCDPCVRNGCYNQDGPLFDTRTSSTYTKVPCSTQLCQSVAAVVRTSCSSGDNTCLYRVPYMDRSATEGCVSRDTLTVGQEKIPGFMFGCSRHYERTFGRYAGIFGFANDRVSFFSQVVEKCRQYRAFSYYLPSPSSVGYIQVGSYDEGGLAFTPMFTQNQDYFLALTGITVDGVPLDLASTKFSGQPQPGPSAFAMYLDLGSALSILPTKVYNRLCDAVAKGIKGYDRIQSGQGCCFDPSFLATERLVPTVQMHFKNAVRLVLNEARLTYETPDERLCLAFQPSSQFLLGSMQVQMTYLVQDVEKSIMGFPRT